MSIDALPESRFFDVQFRNNQLRTLIKRIGGLTLYKSRTINAPKPFIYHDDRTKYQVHVDRENGEIIGLDTFITALNSDQSAENYILALAPVLINGEEYSTPYSLFIVDLDVNHEGQDSDGLHEFKTNYRDRFSFQPTLTIRTKSGGIHLYYYIKTSDIRTIGFNKKIGFAPGIDLLSSMNEGGLHTLVGPGSQAYDKEKDKRKQYQIEKDLPIAPLPQKFIEFLVETYAQVNINMNNALSAVEQAAKTMIKEDEPQNIQLAEHYANKIIVDAVMLRQEKPGEDPYKNTRNDNFNVFAYRLSSFGLSLNTIKRLLHKINMQVFTVPLDEYSFNKTAESAYSARLHKGETFVNAIHNIPEFPPYSSRGPSGERIVTYGELIDRLNARPKEPLKALIGNEKGIQYYSDTVFIASGTYVEVTKRPSDTIFVEAQELLGSNERLTFGHIRNLLNRIELHFTTFNNDARFNLHVGPVPYRAPKDGEKKRGRVPNTISANPLFQKRTISGLRKDFSRPKSNNIVEGDVFHQVAPPPIADFPPLSEQEMARCMPIIEEIIEHFKITLTNPNHPEEIEFLIDRVAAMVQRRDNVQNFIVFFGSGGTGKSTFLRFLSLFVASSDRLAASTFDDITRRFAIPGELTTLDDCDLAKAKQWDVIKSLISADEITVEEKGGKVYTISKKVNLFICTNKQIPEVEKLSDRRLYLLKGIPKYTSEEFVDILDKLTRKLLENNLLALRAFYQYLITKEISITDWNQSSAAQQEMIAEMSSMSQTLGTMSPTIASEKLQQQMNEERHRFRRPILNMIANMGFISSKVSSSVRMSLTLGFTDISPEHIGNSYDVGFMLHYYNQLKDKIYTEEEYYKMISVNIRQKMTNFTSSMLNHKTPFAEVVGEIDSEISRKITTRLPKFKGEIGAKRQFILAPMCNWLNRVCFLVGDSMSESVSWSFLEHYHLTEIAKFIIACKERGEEPTRAQCEEVLKASFPNAILGEFDVINELGDIDSNQSLLQDPENTEGF